MRTSEANGFTIVELVIVIVVSAPILLALLSTSERASRAVNTVERSADASENLRIVAQRVGRLLRSAPHSSIRVPATAADVSAGRAAAVGEWIPAPDLTSMSKFQFRTGSGVLSLNAAGATVLGELEFVLDPNETANTTDDDGDGLEDEGDLWLQLGSVRNVVASGVELCSFQLDGQAMRLSLRCAERDNVQRVHRAEAAHVWWLRNP